LHGVSSETWPKRAHESWRGGKEKNRIEHIGEEFDLEEEKRSSRRRGRTRPWKDTKEKVRPRVSFYGEVLRGEGHHEM
jgi:hypothetical protein